MTRSQHISEKKPPARRLEHPPEGTLDETEHYFRRLRKTLTASLILAFILPLLIVSVYFHLQFNLTLKNSGKLHLISLAESLTNTIDLFLQERVVNIFNIFHSDRFTVNPSQEDMNAFLQSLIETSDAFVDVGFLDKSGEQIGYAGPFPYLYGQDYSREHWFTNLMSQTKNYYISDIYMGFRHMPHFTIAVRQRVGGQLYIMRATVDPGKFYLFLRTIGRGIAGEIALTDVSGNYQVVDPGQGQPLAQSHFTPPVAKGSGAAEMKFQGASELVACAWLREVPWVLSVRQPLNIAYAGMYQARCVIIAISVSMVILIFIAIWLSTARLLRRAELSEKSRKELQSQLFHAAKLMSVGELAAGVAHEINNPLAIIASQVGVIKDMLDPEFGGSACMEPDMPDKIREELAMIHDAVFRASAITHKLLKSARKNESKLAPCNVNALLEDIVSGLMEKEFSVENIELIRNFDRKIPDIMLDGDQMRQVFQNFINNAGDAIEGPGKITLTTRIRDGKVQVIVSDSGKGMPPEVMEKIFLPFFTTKEAGTGTGLGLSISLGIVESMGGTIDVQSLPGAGSSFTVSLPITAKESSQ
ncbi:MAG: ATP-binding protein [Desulfosalsimonadaceae bacterium]